MQKIVKKINLVKEVKSIPSTKTVTRIVHLHSDTEYRVVDGNIPSKQDLIELIEPLIPEPQKLPKSIQMKDVEDFVEDKLESYVQISDDAFNIEESDKTGITTLTINGKKHLIPKAAYAPKLRNFAQMGDTPNTYEGQGLKGVRVKEDETGLEFFAGSGLVDWGEIGGTITDQTDLINYIGTGYVPYTGATGDLNLGGYGIYTNHVTASSSAGILLQANNGTDIGILGAGNTANVAWYGSHTIAGNLIVDTNTLYVDATNNRVGIGGTPTTTFNVFGNGNAIGLRRATAGSDSYINFQTEAGGERGFFGYGSSGNNNFYIWNGHAASMILSTNGVTRQEITSTGNVAFDTNTFYVDAVNDRVIVGGTSSSYKFETIGTATIADRTWAINGSIVMYLPNQAGGQYLGSLFIGNGGRVATAGSALGNTAVGIVAGTALTTGGDNTFIGYGAGTSTTTAIRNVFIGSLAGVSNTTGGENLFMGYAAGYFNTTAVGNVAIGGSSLRYNATGSYNTAIGFTALATGGVNATVDSTTGIGYQAGFNTTGTSYGVYIGMFAGYSNTTGAANTSIGSYTGYNNRTGNNNTYVGFESGYGVAGNSHTSNSALGVYSLFVVSTGSYNTAIGTNAGFVISTGSSNIFLGYNAGYTTTTGSSNVLLGYNIHTPAAGTNNFMSLGNTIFATGVDGTGTTLSSGNVGIYVAAPTARLHLAAGAATANKAPLKFTTGTVNTTAEAGAMEYNNTPHFTNSDAVRRNIVLSDGVYTAGLVVVGGKVKIRIGGTDYNVLVE